MCLGLVQLFCLWGWLHRVWILDFLTCLLSSHSVGIELRAKNTRKVIVFVARQIGDILPEEKWNE